MCVLRWITILVLTFSAILRLFVADAAPMCALVAYPTEANVRSADTRGVLIAVHGGPGLVGAVPGGALDAINDALTATSTSIRFESVVIEGANTPPLIGLSMQRQPEYEIWTNETFRVELPGSLFSDGITCGPVWMRIVPAPGTLDVSGVPRITEVVVNTESREFTIGVLHDEFINAGVRVQEAALPPGLRVSCRLPTAPPSRHLVCTIHQNATFNIPQGTEATVTLLFWREMMRSKLAPRIGDGLLDESARVVIVGVRPTVVEEYDDTNAVDGIPAERMWDGGAVLHLQLFGDTWLQDAARWRDPDVEPVFSVQSRPIQPFGFEFFLSRCPRPTVHVSPRRATFVFPACPGFTLSSIEFEEVSISRLNGLISEGIVVTASFHVVRARPSSITVRWGGSAMTNRLRESDVRISGLQIKATLRYDVFGSGTSIVNIRSMFHGTPQLQLNDLQFQIANLTTLVMTVPPQLTYDIDRSEIINMTLNNRLLSTQTEVARPHAGFIIRPVDVIPSCAIGGGGVLITEEQIRTRNDVTITIVVGTSDDGFCYTDAAVAQLMDAISSESGLLRFTLRERHPSSLVIGIEQDATYMINSNDVVAIPIPNELMCSLEMCRPDPPPTERYTPNSITLAVRTTPGRLVAAFPTLDEPALHTGTLTVELFVRGDTFLLGAFRPHFLVLAGRSTDRGFRRSIEASCGATRDVANMSRAILLCRGNSSYDISADEVISIQLPAMFVASGMPPSTELVTPLTVRVVQGIVVANVQSDITISEEQLIDGGFAMNLTLRYDRWVAPATVASSLRSRVVLLTPPEADGIITSAGDVFPTSAFAVDALETVLTIEFRPALMYNILDNEMFTISLSATAVLSNRDPSNATFTFAVVPSEARLAGERTELGFAMELGTRDVLQGGNFLRIALRNDLWIAGAPFDSRELCPFSPCMFGVDQTRRFLDIIFQSNRDFLTFTNRTFVLPMRQSYFAANATPSGNVSVLIFVTSGRLTWSGPQVVDEDEVRRGTVQVPIILQVDGDLLADDAAVRRALGMAVRCEGANDAFGFCAQASVMFGGVEFFRSADSRRVTLRLQANSEFDVYRREVVTLGLAASGLQSRQAPNASDVYRLTVEASAGQFFLSGFARVISAHDITGATQQERQLVLTLYGERWLADKDAVVRRLVQDGVASSAPDELNGFSLHKAQILPAASATMSSDQRVLTLRLMPTPSYELQNDARHEVVSITIPPSAVMSGIAPVLSSSESSFTVTAGGGIVTISPAAATAEDVRVRGLNFTLAVSAALWDQQVVQNPAMVRDSVVSSAAPQREPSGFAVLRDSLMAQIDSSALGLNGSQLLFAFPPVATYRLLEPEVLTVRISGEWLTNKLPPSPTTFDLRITPDFRVVEVTIVIADVFNPNHWIRVVSEALNVGASRIAIEAIEAEPNLDGEPQYRRIRFRVRAADDAGVPFNNRAAELFMAMPADMHRTRFNVVAAFYNSSPPPPEFWDQFRVGAAPPPPPPSVSASVGYLTGFAGGLVIVLGAVWLYMRYRSGRSIPGVRRIKADEGTGRRPTRDTEAADEADDSLDSTTEMKIYSGQRREVATLHAHTSRVGDDAMPHRALAGLEDDDEIDEVDGNQHRSALDVPLLLYAGQRSAACAERPNEAASELLALNAAAAAAMEASLQDRDDYGVPRDRTIYPPHGDRAAMLQRRSHFDTTLRLL